MRKLLPRALAMLTPYRALFGRLRGQTPPLTPDLAAWIETGGAGQILGCVGEPGIVRRAMPPHPVGAEARVTSIFERNLAHPVYARQVAQIPGALLCGLEGFVRLPDGSYSLQTAWYPQQVTLHPDYYQRRPKPVVEMPGTYFSLVLYWSKYYYHWLAEDLPLLHGVAPFLPPDTRFLIPGPPSKFHLASLALLGIAPERCVPYDGKSAWRLENLIFAPPATTSYKGLPPEELLAGRHRLHHPTRHSGPFNQPPAALRWQAETMVAAAHPSTPPPTPKKIYISRSKAGCRRIVNAGEFEAVLAAHGVQTCHLEDLSLAEQVRLLHGAELVIGPHGAGLTNLMFCRPGTRVLEIFEPSVIRLCFWSISSLMGLDYRYYLGEMQPPPGPDPDIRVDPKKFAGFLQHAIS